jgi:alkyl sulfatase BDS1-like metallo-beta-lactamase superfamily hydrolase
VNLVTGEISLPHESVEIDGDAASFATFLSLLDRFDFWFEIVMP